MKGIVVEIKDKYAVALCTDGRYVKIRSREGHKIGYETDIKPIGVFFRRKAASSAENHARNKYNRPLLPRISSVIAAMIIVSGLGYGAYSYSTPYYYVNMDINPSVELVANRYAIIIKANPLNEDGEKLINETTVLNKKLEDGVDEILDSAVQSGYLVKETPGAVILTVSNSKEEKADELAARLEEKVVSGLAADAVTAELLTSSASMEEHDNAKTTGLSAGKLKLIEKAREAQPDLELKIEDLKDKPVSEIMGYIHEGKKDGKGLGKGDNQDNGNGAGELTGPDEPGATNSEKTGSDKTPDDKGLNNDGSYNNGTGGSDT
ncbi:MAG: anti-sigma factor domain-containing protein, partial [Clostridiales bacterium]|nr:anti-sigma factor domain-containing protein [Clostridiales bacterium]